jgi:hypothetical protein
MKTNLNLLQTRIFRAVALGIGSFFDLAAAPPSWVTNSATVTDNGTNKSVTLPATNSPQFFRLRRP